jgi:hypothetical protein
MSRVLFVAFVLSSLLCCKKIVEDTKRNYILDIMTNGQWYVESFLEGDTDITNEFDGYSFQFREDGTVSGIKDGSTEDGTWEGNTANYSITSNFANAAPPLIKLNGTWMLKDSGVDFVAAEMQVSSGKNRLKLRKKA